MWHTEGAAPRLLPAPVLEEDSGEIPKPVPERVPRPRKGWLPDDGTHFPDCREAPYALFGASLVGRLAKRRKVVTVAPGMRLP